MSATPVSRLTATFAVFLALFVLSLPAARADDFTGLKQARAVWDVTLGDPKAFASQVQLLSETADMLRQRGIEPHFVIAIHGPATKFVVRALAGTGFQKEVIPGLPKIHALLQRISASGIPVEVCAVAMLRNDVARRNVLPFVRVEENVWENIIALQNKGYAYMPIR